MYIVGTTLEDIELLREEGEDYINQVLEWEREMYIEVFHDGGSFIKEEDRCRPGDMIEFVPGHKDKVETLVNGQFVRQRGSDFDGAMFIAYGFFEPVSGIQAASSTMMCATVLKQGDKLRHIFGTDFAGCFVRVNIDPKIG